MKYFLEKNIDILNNLEYQYPNDMDFGYQIRLNFRDDVYVLSVPNDQILGKKIRKIIKKFVN